MTMSVGLDAKTQKAALEGVMPWLAPTGLAAETLTKLDRPLLAWMQDPQRAVPIARATSYSVEVPRP
jgi:hypothetical protein